MQLEGINFLRLTPEYVFKPFNCGDADLNEFFLKDSIDFQRKLLAVTYVLETDTETVAFFSIFNDKISLKDVGNPNIWDKIRGRMPIPKKLGSYPAMKIGRLGVSENYKGKGIGKAILDYIKVWFTTNNRTGCKFITVDAYAQSLDFYSKNGFVFLTEKDKNKDTRAMYFDLAILQEV